MRGMADDGEVLNEADSSIAFAMTTASAWELADVESAYGMSVLSP